MLIIALLLVALGAAACVIVAIQASDPVTVSLLGQSINTSARELFLAGAVVGLIVGLALWMFKASSARAHRRRQEAKDLQRTRRTEVERLEAEKAELESALRRRNQSAPEPMAAPSRRVVETEPEQAPVLHREEVHLAPASGDALHDTGGAPTRTVSSVESSTVSSVESNSESGVADSGVDLTTRDRRAARATGTDSDGGASRI